MATQEELAQLANRIEGFIRHVEDYLAWAQVHDLTGVTAYPTAPGSPAEAELLGQLADTAGRKGDAAALIRRDGPQLAAALEGCGRDSSGVLAIAHCVGRGGGGPNYIRAGWPQLKVALQRAALQLRGGEWPSMAKKTAPDAVADDPALPNRARVALNQYTQAVEASGRNKLTDPEAYEYLTDVYKKARADGDTTDELPEFGTWRRYLSEARKRIGAQKHQPRIGRGKSRSIVKRSEV